MAVKMVFIVFALALLTGCPPHIPTAPVVAIADHLVVVPAGQAYTADRLGYWISAEAMTKLLDQLNSLQRQVNELQSTTPRTQSSTKSSTFWSKRGLKSKIGT